MVRSILSIVFTILPILIFSQFSQEKLISKIREMGFSNPHLVLAQSQIETSNFTSLVFRANHNLFGMRMPKRRKTTAVNSKNGYAVYKKWEDSVEDFYFYYKIFLENKSEKEYLDYIGHHYATNPQYSKEIEKRSKDNLKYFK